jgi:hypothetical protein
MSIDDCLDGIDPMMESDFAAPFTIGSSEMVTIEQLVDFVEAIAGPRLERRCHTDAP